MKLFIDECLSPELARRINEGGEFEAIHPRDRGRLRDKDARVLQRCLEEDRVIVTENAIDFRKLIGNVELHPGMIISAERRSGGILAPAQRGARPSQGAGRPGDRHGQSRAGGERGRIVPAGGAAVGCGEGRGH